MTARTRRRKRPLDPLQNPSTRYGTVDVGNTPGVTPPIPGLIGWWDVSNAASRTMDGSEIEGLADLSGVTGSLTDEGSGGADLLPAEQNGLDAGQFTSGLLRRAGDTLGIGTDALLLATVLRLDGSDSGAMVGLMSAGSTPGEYGLFRGSTSITVRFEDDSATRHALIPVISQDTWIQVTQVIERGNPDGANIARMNGSQEDSVTWADNGEDLPPSTNNYTFGLFNSNGPGNDGDFTFGELRLYRRPSNFTPAEIDQVENELATKWSVP